MKQLTAAQKVKWLKDTMLEHKKSQREISEVAMCEYQTVRAWLCGAREIPESKIELIRLRLLNARG